MDVVYLEELLVACASKTLLKYFFAIVFLFFAWKKEKKIQKEEKSFEKSLFNNLV